MRLPLLLMLLLATGALCSAPEDPAGLVRRVIVRLADPPHSAGRSRAASARSSQDHLLSALADDGYTLASSLSAGGIAHREARYATAINAVALDLPRPMELSEVSRRMIRVPGVLGVWPERRYAPSLFTSAEQAGATSAWASLASTLATRPGAGVRVAIVDGGTNCNTSMMSGAGFAWPQDVPSPGLGETGNCNGKVVVSRAYFHASDPPLNADEGHSWPGPLATSHGVHCSSVAAGVPVTVSVNGTLYNISGMAPYAWVMNYRVFYRGKSGDAGGYTADILAALDDAVADGAQVISNSWGSTAFANSNDIIDLFVTAASEQYGVVFVFAAGNSGPKMTTADHPGTSAIRVGAVSTSKDIFNVITTDPDLQNVTLPVKTVVSAYGETITDLLTLKTVDSDEDILACSPLTSGNYSGSAIVVRRGTCSINSKAVNAANAGALLLIVANTDDGKIPTFSVTTKSIPVVCVSKSHGDALIDLARENESEITPTVRVDLEPRTSRAVANAVADFSSRGPNVDMRISPDVAAPGVNVYAAGYGPTEGAARHFGYGSASGTSMACPHVSGAAALVLQANPGFSAAQVKSALMTTASLGLTDQDDDLVTPLDVGAGAIDIASALSPNLFVSPPDGSFQIVRIGVSRVLTFSAVAYKSLGNLTVEVVPLAGSNASSVSFFSVTPSLLTTVANGSTYEINVTFSNSNGEAGDYYGYLVFRNTSGTDMAHLPLWARAVFAPVADVALIDLDWSNCNNSMATDLETTYTSAFAAVNLSTVTFQPDCSASFTWPHAVAYGSFKTALIFTGKSGVADVDLSDLLAETTALASQGTSIAVMGAGTAGLFSDDSTSFLTLLCYASWTQSTSVSTVKSHSYAPGAFYLRPTRLTSTVKTNLIYFFGYNEETPFLAMPNTAEYYSLSKSYVPQELIYTSFNSACYTSSLGLESLSSSVAASLSSVVFKHLNQNKPAYTVSLVSGSKGPSYKLQINISDTNFVPEYLLIAWGETSSTEAYLWSSNKATVSHKYERVGSYSPLVVAASNVGRYFYLQHDIVLNVTDITEDISTARLAAAIAVVAGVALIGCAAVGFITYKCVKARRERAATRLRRDDGSWAPPAPALAQAPEEAQVSLLDRSQAVTQGTF